MFNVRCLLDVQVEGRAGAVACIEESGVRGRGLDGGMNLGVIST